MTSGPALVRCLSIGVVHDRQGEEEAASFAGLALHPDLPTVGFDDPLGDREPKSNAAVIPSVRLPELTEDVRQMLGGDSGPSVTHFELQRTLPRRASHDDAPAPRRELDGI